MDSQTLLKLTHKLCSNLHTNVTQPYLKLVTIDPQTLFKYIHKPYSNLLEIRQN